MTPWLAQADPRLNMWALPPYSPQVWIAVIATVLVGILLIIGLTFLPTNLRRPVVTVMTFLAGSFYVGLWLWPQPIAKTETDLPRDMVESVGFWFQDAQQALANVANILTAFLLLLGMYSLLRIHLGRISKKHPDRAFSVVLIISMVLIVIFGYADWRMRTFMDPQNLLELKSNWTFWNHGRDILFDGLLMQMDAAMFSLIAFFILSAAFRAFRIRSVEATVMMVSALILIISLMPLVIYQSEMLIRAWFPNPSPGDFNPENYKIGTIAGWVKSNLQTPSLRAVEFGVGLGALAMGLRLWLGLEKGGVSV
jgi:hypothetical protein